MNTEEEFRVVPGYENYGVTRNGVVKLLKRDLTVNQYLLNGYWVVDACKGSITTTLPTHRAVALAWVKNHDLKAFPVVNHRDGVTVNNWYKNLEWTNCSGNNYHAVNNGLRSDNIRCRVRDFYTREIKEFSSIAQAAEYMGLSKDAPIVQLRPKKFGTLISNRYEFRYANETNPWFYEHRTERVPPSRYMVTVKDSNGDVREVYSTRALLKDYQLYGGPSKSIPALADYGNALYPDKEFTVRDSYAEAQFRILRGTRGSKVVPVRATRAGKTLEFRSLTRCASHFGVDRSSVIYRLNNGKELDGWTFIQNAPLASNG